MYTVEAIYFFNTQEEMAEFFNKAFINGQIGNEENLYFVSDDNNESCGNLIIDKNKVINNIDSYMHELHNNLKY